MIATARHRTWRLLSCVLLAVGLLVPSGPVEAETVLKPISTQYIAALGDPGATSGKRGKEDGGSNRCTFRIIAAGSCGRDQARPRSNGGSDQKTVHDRIGTLFRDPGHR